MGYSWGGFESLIVPFDAGPARTATVWKTEGPALRLHIGLENVEISSATSNAVSRLSPPEFRKNWRAAKMSQHECVFCNFGALSLIAENELAFAVRDKFPVKPLHTLIIPKRHVALQCRQEIEKLDPSVAGFNFGSNIGEAAGQKSFMPTST